MKSTIGKKAVIKKSKALRCDPRLFQAFELIGRPWTGAIIATLLSRPARFNELKLAIEGITARILAQRLGELEEVGIISRRILEKRPPGTIYELTATGQCAAPAFEQLASWGSKLKRSRIS